MSESRNVSETTEAIWNGDCKKMDELFNAGLPVDVKVDSTKLNLLHLPFTLIRESPSVEIVQYLIDRGVSLNERDSAGWTPLHYAVSGRHNEGVKVLIDAGAEVDPLTDKNMTPLYMCVQEKPFNIEVAELLLESGADIDTAHGDAMSIWTFAHEIDEPDSGILLSVIETYHKA